MKTLMTILISLFCLQVYAPPAGLLPTKLESELMQSVLHPNPYLELIRAVVQVESNGNHLAYNPKENAVGAFQIRQIRVTHYNQLRGTDYKLTDFYDYDLSLEMFMYYARGKDWEKAAKDWNGSGKLTIIYWNKIKSQLAQL